MISDLGERAFDRERTLPRLLSTDDVPEKERFSYWREMTNHAFLDLRPERTTSAPDPFFGSIAVGELGYLRLAFVRSGSQRVHRTTAEIARSPRPLYFVNLQLEGESTLAQGREPVRMTTGDIALVDVTRPFELGFCGPFCHVSIELPHRILGERLADRERAGGSVVRGSVGLGSLVAGYLRAAATMTEQGDLVASDALANNLVDLLGIAFGASAEAARQAGPSIEDARLRSVCAYVERNLADPSLTPSRIAADLKVSTRYLHKLFERRSETLMQWIVRRRLEQCRRDLAHPAMRDRGIAEIAFAWGFSDLSHFGRAFKAAYGETPRDFRRRASSLTTAG